jgi:hypothetical protein
MAIRVIPPSFAETDTNCFPSIAPVERGVPHIPGKKAGGSSSVLADVQVAKFVRAIVRAV